MTGDGPRSRFERRAGGVLLAISVAAVVWGLLIILDEGRPVRLGPIRLSSRYPSALVAGGLGIFLLHAWFWRQNLIAQLSAIGARLERRAPLCAAALAGAVFIAAFQLAPKVAGGADSYGYLTEAALWRHGQLVIQEDVIRESPWPFAASTFAPIGFRDAPGRRDAIVPTYAPGFPLLMALLQRLFGYCAAFWLVPICAGGAVWLTYTVGTRVFDRRDLGLWSGLLVATSPTFLYQSMNQMSDVPVTAAWTLALLLAITGWPLAAGLASAVAVAIRPNLVPVAIALLGWMALLDIRTRRATGRVGTMTLRAAVGLAPAIVGIAWLNTHLYGSPLESGYGHLEDLYSWRYVWKNVTQFATWIGETDTPVVVLAAVFFIAPWALTPARIAFPRVLLGGVAAIVVLSYLVYQPFDAWWYLRFLLPAWPIVMLLTAAALDAIVRRWVGAAIHRAAVAVVVVALAWHRVAVTADRGAFDLWRGESRYIDVAKFVAESTDPKAVILGYQHTGSIRYYADRLTLHFLRLDERWLDRAVAHLQSTGRRPYFVLDRLEVDLFRARFAALNRLGALDWRPIAVFEFPYVAVYDPANRAAQTVVISSSDGWPTRHCEQPHRWPPRVHIP